MPQKLIQIQQQRLAQQQRLTAQQMLQVKLIEMSVAELEENIKAELDDNPALESVAPDSIDYAENMDTAEPTDSDDDFLEQRDREDRQDALNDALKGLGSDDEMDDQFNPANYQNADYEERVYGDTTSFADKLKEQMGMLSLSDEQQTIMEYLIGSLDDDGYLRKPIDTIADELAIYQGIDTTDDEIAEVLKMLQLFDPPGIGAQSLQQCLLLQIERRAESGERETETALLHKVIAHHFDAFMKKHWTKIQQSLGLTDVQVEQLQKDVRRLNPKPGASLGETIGRSLQQITPDFIVDTDDGGTVSFSLNNANLPELIIEPSFVEELENYKKQKGSMNRMELEAYKFTKDKVEKAQNYIEAIRQRRNTLYTTMHAIIGWQHKFFQSGDETDMQPMILKDIAQQTGLDISTISRVSNQKYAQTRWGTYPLRFFFTDGYTTEDGTEMSTRKIKIALREIIEQEDKRHPLSDEALTNMLKEKGYPIARRTVAKYREKLGIPTSRLRKR